MPKWWRVGFLSVLILTFSALLTYVALLNPVFSGEHELAKVKYRETNNLPWAWADTDIECKEYISCVHISVAETKRCKNQLSIDVTITDKNDHWVGNVGMVVDSPNSASPAIIEVGVDRSDFEYFLVGDVICASSPPNQIASL
jgi:hypothetical protein